MLISIATVTMLLLCDIRGQLNRAKFEGRRMRAGSEHEPGFGCLQALQFQISLAILYMQLMTVIL